MKVPTRITEILKEKQEFINKNRDKLEKSVIKLQDQLLSQVLAEVIPSLDVKDGVILETTHNYRILADLDKVYKDFTKISTSLVGGQISTTNSTLIEFGKKYFTVVLGENITARFDKIVAGTAKLMNARIGLEGGEMVRGGFMESFLADKTLGMQIKNYVSKSITGQIDTKEFIKGLTKIINGDEGPGGLEKQYQRYAYDLYQQYDAAYNSKLAEEFEMNYFVYQGGLIDESRDFCAAHNNKVWSREEAEDWSTWTPSLGEYPEGYEIRSKTPNETPSYLGYPGYVPLVDRGGYNCRHMLGWISDAMAYDLRPELKEN
jgi:hypothetical protein